MGRQGSGVELRTSSIRVSFILDGVKERATLNILPTPANERAAEKIVIKVRQAIANRTFVWADWFPDAPQSKGVANGEVLDFGQWCNLYMETKGQSAKKTRMQYRNALGVWRALLGENSKIEKLTHAKVAAKVGGTPWASAKLLNNYLIPLRGVFKLAGRDLKFDNPMEGIENSKAQGVPPDPLTAIEMDSILAELKKGPEQMWAYFEFAFLTGMRPEELIELRWSDIDWASGTARVERARTAGEVKSVKTYEVRDVDLVSRAVVALEAMQKWIKHSLDDGDKANRQIFQHPELMRSFHDERSQRDTFWRPVLQRLGIRWHRPYQTRHTYATNALRAGVNPSYISRQMGHANAKMLFTVYAKWIDGADRGREKEKLEAMLLQNCSPIVPQKC